ncbi:MAG TPA: amidohydrolase family protein [Vicinamibacteria bacterium]|nr:amidohydrolase family protein [Vicinamibacteria bacterium]
MLLSNCRLATLDPPRVEEAHLRIEAGRIAERGPGLTARAGEEALDLGGALVMPGLVNAHTHLYSALARGMPGPAEPARSFVEILERVWWRLDRALDPETVYLSGLAGAIEAALSGTTLLFDHHASPAFIRGSLGVLERAVREVGLRSVLCYEVTDRNGAEGCEQGIAENAAFASSDQEWSRSLIGAHASLTLSDETMSRLGRLVQETGRPLHIHAAEDEADVEDCRRRTGAGLLARLSRHGLLTPGTLLAHGVHLTRKELAEAQAAGAWLVHNPRSNMNNAVGYAPTDAFRQAALGTDGMDGDLLAEVRVAYLKMREEGRPDAFAAARDLLAGGHRLAASIFGLPFGRLDPGAPADLAVFDYQPPTPLGSDELTGHLLFGLDRSHVTSVMVGGRFVVRDRRLVNVDAPAVLARARTAALGLWRRMQALEG